MLAPGPGPGPMAKASQNIKKNIELEFRSHSTLYSGNSLQKRKEEEELGPYASLYRLLPLAPHRFAIERNRQRRLAIILRIACHVCMRFVTLCTSPFFG